MRSCFQRAGVTLLELLAVLAILAVLVGLLLPAVQKVRQAASRMQVCHQVRQITLGIHHSADTKGGLLPNTDGDRTNGSVFHDILPYLESREPDPRTAESPSKLYLSPADPSYAVAWPAEQDAHGRPKRPTGDISYAVNPLVCRSGMRVDGILDGTSSTVLLAERYARCGQSSVWSTLMRTPCGNSVNGVVIPVPCTKYRTRRATFADADYDDVLPVAGPSPGTTWPSLGGATFQAGVPPQACDPRTPQTAFAAGMIVGLTDGSARLVRVGVEPSAFWGAVTPSGGEVLGDW